MAMTLLRRKTLYESFSAMAKADAELAGYWEQIAEECNRLYEGLWNEILKDDEAWEILFKVLETPMPERPCGAAQMRRKIQSKLGRIQIKEMLILINNALKTDEWAIAFSDNETLKKAYEELKGRFEEVYTEEFVQRFHDRYRQHKEGETEEGESESVFEIVEKLCFAGAAENLVKETKETENYLLDEKLWEKLYEAEKRERETRTTFNVISKLLHCMDVCLEREPGETLKMGTDYEWYKLGLEKEERRFQVLEEAFFRLKRYRTELAGDNWFSYWKQKMNPGKSTGKNKGETWTVFFVLAAGQVKEDKTRFNQILGVEMGVDNRLLWQNEDGVYATSGLWYWTQGEKIAELTKKVNTEACCSELGGFSVPEPAREAVYYILNEISKWRNLHKDMKSKLRWSTCTQSEKMQNKKSEELLVKCNKHMEDREKAMREAMKWRHPSNPCPWNLCQTIEEREKGKEKKYYLADSENSLYQNVSIDQCYEALRYVVECHPCRNYNSLLISMTAGRKKEAWGRYMELLDSFDEIKTLKKRCDKFISERNRLQKKMREEYNRLKRKKKDYEEGNIVTISRGEREGLFGQWLQKWEELTQAEKEFENFESRWEEEERKQWEFFDFFAGSYQCYREKVMKAFENSYMLLDRK